MLFPFAPRTSYGYPYDTTAPDSLDTLIRVTLNQACTAYQSGIISRADWIEFTDNMDNLR